MLLVLQPPVALGRGLRGLPRFRLSQLLQLKLWLPRLLWLGALLLLPLLQPQQLEVVLLVLVLLVPLLLPLLLLLLLLLPLRLLPMLLSLLLLTRQALRW